MQKSLLICIDDTDNLESIGTGQVLENMCREMQDLGFGEAGFVSRHQLLIHEQIAYTSHNSSMCCEFRTGNTAEVLSFTKTYLEEHAAEGSDPGLCILPVDAKQDYSALTAFGLRAQSEVLRKADAYLLAEQFPELSLSEHGGTGDGVIGALAGVGLRLSGSDGRIKGKIQLENGLEQLTVSMFCSRYGVDQILTADHVPLSGDTTLIFDKPTKAILLNNRKTVLAERIGAEWHPIPHKGRKQ